MTEAVGTKALAREIAQALEEKQVRLVQRVVAHIGAERARQMLQETLSLDAQGGLMTLDGSRRRTPGGTFFFLVRQQLTAEEVAQLFPPTDWRAKRERKRAQRAESGEAAPAAPQPPPAPKIPVLWAARTGLVEALLADKTTLGRTETVKVTLIGRPGKVIEQGATVLTTMQGGDKVPAMPKGVPVPDQVRPMTYLVYLAEKQWRKVAEAIQDPDDALIVEGVLVYDGELKKLSVLASNVTTKALQRAKRQPG